MSKGWLALVTAALALWMGSASAASFPVFYLVPTGPTTVPTVVPVGTSTYQLWVDPSGVTASNCATVGAPINGGCNGIYGVNNLQIAAGGSLTMTAFTSNTSAPAFTSPSPQLQGPQCFSIGMVPTIICFSSSLFIPNTGDFTNGNATPFQIGAMTVTNNGSGGGDVDFMTIPSSTAPPQYLDANLSGQDFLSGQTLAIAAPVPEPSTLLLLGAALGGLAAAVRMRRPRTN